MVLTVVRLFPFGCICYELNRSIFSKWAIFELCLYCIQYCSLYRPVHSYCTPVQRCVSPFGCPNKGPIHAMRHVSVPSSFRQNGLCSRLSVVFSHLREQHKIGSLRLFPSNMQPTATECIFRYLLIIRTSVMIEL